MRSPVTAYGFALALAVGVAYPDLAASQERSLALSLTPGIGVVHPLTTFGTFDIGEGRLSTSPMVLASLELASSRWPVALYATGATSLFSGMEVRETGCSADCASRESDGRLFLATAGLEIRHLFTPAMLAARVGVGRKVRHRTSTEIVGCGPADRICPAHQYFRRSRSERTYEIGLAGGWTWGKHMATVSVADFISWYEHRDGRPSVVQHDVLLSLGLRWSLF